MALLYIDVLYILLMIKHKQIFKSCLHVCLLRESSKKRQKCLLQELDDDAIPSTVRDKVKEENNDRHAGHKFQSFSFESISTATSDFSIENELGQDGFAPV